MLRQRHVVVFTVVAALAVFCIVQDRVTAAGAERYVAIQRAALAAGRPPVPVDDVMDAAVQRSVRQGFLWSGIVAAVGLFASTVVGRRPRE